LGRRRGYRQEMFFKKGAKQRGGWRKRQTKATMNNMRAFITRLSHSRSLRRAAVMLVAMALSNGCGPNADESDWLAAQKANTADGYITYLVKRPQGAFASNARKSARRFLTVKYIELPGGDEVLITNELGDMNFYGTSGESTHSEHTVKHVMQDGSEITFDKIDFQFRSGNAILQPRIPSASIYYYDDHEKGVKLSGFDISLRGTSQSAPIFQMADEKAAVLHEKEQRARCAGNLRMLDETKRKWALENGKKDGDTPFAVHIIDYLPGKQLPECPDRGTYTLNRVGQRPECSVHGTNF